MDMEASQVVKTPKKFICEPCGYGTNHKGTFNRHNKSPRHKNILKDHEINSTEEQKDLAKYLKEEDINIIKEQVEFLTKETKNLKSELKKKSTELKNKEYPSSADVESEKMKRENEELKTKLKEAENLNYKISLDLKTAHNRIQELKGNIRVFCRVRPRTRTEIKQMKALSNINFINKNNIEIKRFAGNAQIRQKFSFDKVFAPKATQKEIFEELSLFVQLALEGCNVCVFAYGQTGSGKTYTMEGERELETEGMIPRTVRHIFKEMKKFEALGWEYRIEASFLEIYNEHIIDLLEPQSKQSHKIRMEGTKDKDLYVSNLRIKEIHSSEELHECLRTAQRNRTVAATQSHERSSRSHSVTRIRLIGTHSTEHEVSIGNLNLVDLAGSERLQSEEAVRGSEHLKSEEAVRATETKNINKSLANLSNVILALLKKQDYVPYRTCKLTNLLMPSFEGNWKILMLLNISPLDECYSETIHSLRFASDVKICKTGNVKQSRMLLANASY